MKQLRFLTAIAVAGLAFNACVPSPTALDDECDPDVEDCAPVKPTGS